MVRSEWPHNGNIEITAENAVRYGGKPIGRVIPPGRFWAGKVEFFDSSAGDFGYDRDHAAYLLATRFVRGRLG